MALYVALDLETLGLGRSAPIIELGAHLSEWMTGEIISSCHTYVTHDSYDNCEPYAMAMHPEKLMRIATRAEGWRYTPIDELVTFFDDWLAGHHLGSKANRKVTLAGKNLATFDMPCLENQCMWWLDWVNKYAHHRVIDPGNLFWQPDVDECLPNSDTCRERAHIERLDEEKHDALADAEDVVKMVSVAVGRRVGPQRLFQELHK